MLRLFNSTARETLGENQAATFSTSAMTASSIALMRRPLRYGISISTIYNPAPVPVARSVIAGTPGGQFTLLVDTKGPDWLGHPWREFIPASVTVERTTLEIDDFVLKGLAHRKARAAHLQTLASKEGKRVVDAFRASE